MNDIVQVAEQVRAQAQREEAAAFDRQYQLARRTEQALAALEAAGHATAQRWAEDDRRAQRDAADRRFDPEPDEPGPDGADAVPTTVPTTVRSTRRPIGDAADDWDDEGEDEPTTWLR